VIVTQDTVTGIPVPHFFASTIEIGDVDEKPTEITVTPFKVDIDEGYFETGIKLADIEIIDDALGTNELTALPEDGPFEYRNVNGNTAELWLKDGAELSHEIAKNISVSLGVIGSGDGTDPAPTTFHLNVNDVDEKPTEIKVTPIKKDINEGFHEVGVKLADITIVDDALGTNELTALPEDGPFEYRNVNGNTAELWLKDGAELDFEGEPEVLATVEVTASGIGADPAAKLFKLNVLNLDEPEIWVDDDLKQVESYSFTHAENLAQGSIIGKVQMRDPDGKASFTYALAEESEMFKIDAVTGHIALLAGQELDYETAQNHNLKITADIMGGLYTYTDITVTLEVTDVDEPVYFAEERLEGDKTVLAPVSAYTFTADEDIASGTVIGTVMAVDPEKKALLIYSLPNGSELFKIEGITGKITLLRDQQLDYETLQKHSLSIMVIVTEEKGNELVSIEVTLEVGNIIEAAVAEVIYIDDVVAGAHIGAVKFGGDGAEYIVKEGDTETVSTLFEVTAQGYLAVKAAANLAIGDYALTLETGEGDNLKTLATTIRVAETVEITGMFTASEDSPIVDPAGQITMVDPARADYVLSINGTSITADGTKITASYGTLTVDTNGAWVYDLDNSNTDVEALDGDDDDIDGAVGTLTETITLAMTRADDPATDDINEAETLSRSFTITINGRTDVYLTADQSSYYAPNLYEDYTIHASKASSLSYQNFYSLRGSDVLEGNDLPNQIYARSSFDVLNGYGGDDRLGSTGGSDIIHGGEGNDTSLYRNRYISDVNVDLADPIKWKYNRATGEWESGSGDGYTYIRATYRHEYDDDGDGIYDDFRIEYDYMTSIENLESSANGSIRGVLSNNVFSGDDGKNILSVSSSISIMNGRGGDDEIYGGYEVDQLIGGKGEDLLCGSRGDDIFVLYHGEHAASETNRDTVIDFSSGTASGYSSFDGSTSGGEDKIRVDTALGTETTLASLKTAAEIRWTNSSKFDTGTIYNDKSLNDTMIYATQGTADTADDIIIMVLEDYSAELTFDNFEIV